MEVWLLSQIMEVENGWDMDDPGQNGATLGSRVPDEILE